MLVVCQRDGARLWPRPWLRHCPDTKVLTSCRLEGRAPGRVAETLVRWSGLESANAAWDEIDRATSVARVHRLRVAHAANPRGETGFAGLARGLRVERAALDAALAAPTFGVALEQLGARSPALHPRRVPAGRLAAEIGYAQRLIAALPPAGQLSPEPSGPVDAAEIAA